MAEEMMTAKTESKEGSKDSSTDFKIFLDEIAACKRERRDLIDDWATNNDYRRGTTAESDGDSNRSPVAVDWSQTKAKQASLFSQVPQVVVRGEPGEETPYKSAFPVFQRRLNYRLKKAKIGVAMDEVTPDVISTAGVGAAIVTYEARTEMRDVPMYDEAMLTEEQILQVQAGMFENPMVPTPFITDRRFQAKRLSPADLLWPVDFTGSDFDEGPWIGRSGRMTWAEAKRKFDALTDDMKEKVCGDDRTDQDFLVSRELKSEDKNIVQFDEIFYWRYRYHPEEPSFKAIHHLVFLKGMKTPVVNEPWKGQRWNEETMEYIGVCQFPIQVVTLTYMSDECIPPSDSAVGRPMVDELIEFHKDMRAQRKHSVPVRWFDVNRIDTEIQTQLMDGDWQGMVPINGDGNRAVGEVARANYPRENWELERATRDALRESWKVGPNQVGTMAKSGEHSATESSIVQENYATQVGYERAKMVKFFLGLANVMAGYMVLYDDFDTTAGLSDMDKQRLQALDLQRINHEAVLDIRADATVLLDSNQRYDRLDRFLNKTGQSGYVDVKPIIEEMAALTQLDPDVVVITPQPKSPDQPNVSMRFSGDDLLGPMASIVLAILAKNGQAPTAEELPAVFKLMQAAGITPGLMTPGQSDGQEVAQPGRDTPTVPDNPNPNWGLQPSIDKRESAE